MPKTIDINSRELYIPPGIDIQEAKYGLSLFATRDFQEGEILYDCYFPIIEKSELKPFEYETPIGKLRLEPKEHFTLSAKGKFIHWGFSAYTNHSCSPNVVNLHPFEDDFFSREKMVAMRDIKMGDEITCSYHYLDYGKDDSIFTDFICECGAINCCKEFKGFGALEYAEQLKLFPNCYPYVKRRYLEEIGMVVKSKLPLDKSLKG